VLTAQQQQEHAPNFGPLRTREEVRRYVAAHAARKAARHVGTWRTPQFFRRTTLLSVLCFSTLQYYFLSIGLEILSIPNLIVFVPTAGLG
jgi:hypothetical protein